MTFKRYGKESKSLLEHKSSFFKENRLHVDRQRELATIYKRQPRRAECKNCDTRLDEVVDFVKDGIGYVLCSHCGHLNGTHQDTHEFCAAVYTENSGASYAKNYQAKDVKGYQERVAGIYAPKAQFLFNALSDHGLDPHSLSYMDFGAGSGYLVSALNKLGLERVIGTDVSQSQVDFGNAMIGMRVLQTHRMGETSDILQRLESQVVCMIGTLEHLQHPREVLRCLQQNDHVQFLFLSLPMFSLAVFLEILSPHVFHRQLHGGHTHLYTGRSLAYLCQEFGFESMAEWWFGTDVVDLYRHVAVALSVEGYSERVRNLWRQDFAPLIDALQLTLDKGLYSSQVHVLLRKRDANL